MKKALLGTSVAVALTAIGPSVSSDAAVTLCTSPGCVQPDSNVLFESDTSGSTVVGTLNDAPAVEVLFTGNETLSANASGQARISGEDGALTFLSFMLGSGQTFGEVEFNLNALSDGFATLTFLGAGGSTLFTSDPLAISGGGQNFFGAFGEPFTEVQISSTVPLQDVRQVRLGELAAVVPEPSTWGMMLLGFGAIGVLLRRRRKPASLTQTA